MRNIATREEVSIAELLKSTDTNGSLVITVMILSFWTNRSGQTVQTQIRLLLDQGLHCLLFHLHLFDKIRYSLPLCLDFR